MNVLNLKVLLLAFVVLCGGLVDVRAEIVRTERVDSELVSDHSAVVPGQTLWIGLRQKIIPHWHTYWKNPGDSGEPTSIKWSVPDGVQIGDILWPVPKPIDVGPLRNFGFEGEYILLSQLTVPEEGIGDRLDIRAKAYWLVCEEICIPEEGELSLSLPVDRSGPLVDPAWSSEIQRTLESLPREFEGQSQFLITEDGVVMSLESPEISGALAAVPKSTAFFFPEEDGYIENAAEQEFRRGDIGVSLAMKPGFKIGTEIPDRLNGVLVITSEIEGLEEPDVTALHISATAGDIIPGTAEVSVGGAPRDNGLDQFGEFGLAQALLFGVLGGLILNLMPCVFPILSLKALNFMQESERPDHVRAGGLAYTAGVLATFLALAGILIAIRAGGEAAGWAFHLQDPLVLALLTYLMFAVGLNLSGVFNVGVSVAAGGGSGVSSSFLTGVLAVVIASPCTAPFMATALGFALTQGTFTTLTVFAALGLGMALPYLALSFSPGLIRLLPKPGAWMDTFKQVLAFPVYLTAAWLLWVLSKQISPDSLFLVLIGLVFVGLGAWLFGKLASLETARSRWSGAAATAGVGLVSVLLLQGLAPREGVAGTGGANENTPAGGVQYASYSPETVDGLLAEGKTVFANFTADWCITCKVNERVALNRPKVISLFEEQGIVALKADWTNKNEEIARTLEAHGRSGVPLYLVFRPDAEGGAKGVVPEVLPQILTQSIVLNAFSSPEE